MNLQLFLSNRESRLKQEPLFRTICLNCHQPDFTCYCKHVVPFACGIKFVILIHHLEFRRRIATGRLAHLCMRDSELIRGYSFAENVRVNTLINDPTYHCVVLYPGHNSVNLTDLSQDHRDALTPQGKQLLVFVIDGTWSTAKKMLRQSPNLLNVPKICFTPKAPSRFRVRKQPKELCYSSVEAIHHTIDLLVGAKMPSGHHNNLLLVFDKMVEQQLDFIEKSHRVRPYSRHRGASPVRS